MKKYEINGSYSITVDRRGACKGSYSTTVDRRGACKGSYSTTVDRRGACKVLVWKPEGKDRLENLCIEGRIISKWTFKKWDAVAWAGLMWFS